MMLLRALAAAAADDARAAMRRNAGLGLLYGVAALAVLGIVGMGLISAHRWVSAAYGPYEADLAVAMILLVVLAVALIAIALLRARMRRRRAFAATVAVAAPIAVGLAGRRLPMGLTTLALALVSGGIAGRVLGRTADDAGR